MEKENASSAGVLDALKQVARQPLYWVIVIAPLAAVLNWVWPHSLWVFVASGVAIIPLAGLMGRATESISETLGAGIGGLLNATFGNAAELIIAAFFLWSGPEMYSLVKASITGSIIGNILLVLGLAILLGGLKFDIQTFNRTAASMGATLLALATIGLIMPTIYFYLYRAGTTLSPEELETIEFLSEEIAVILAVIYLLSLVFSLWTHHQLFTTPEGDPKDKSGNHHPEWTRNASIVILFLATAGIAWMAELLVGSVEHAAEVLGMNRVFIGVIVVAVVGNAAEHSTAVWMAMKNKMDLAVHIAVGSGLQIALFVAPALVFLSMLFGWIQGHGQPMDLHFTPMEITAVILSVAVLALASQDGESHWMEGVMLLGVYLILALAFYHLPQGGELAMETPPAPH